MRIPADSLRAVLDSVFTAREYRWVERPEARAFLRRWMGMLQQWLIDLREAHPTTFRLLLAGLVLIVLASFLHAGWILLQTIRAASRAPAGTAAAPAFRRDRAWYQREADRLALEGRYAQAMQYDFLALILALDAAALVRFHPSKTPGEYTREARLDPGALADFRRLVQALYGYVFARRSCGPREFAEWRILVAPERYAAAA